MKRVLSIAITAVVLFVSLFSSNAADFVHKDSELLKKYSPFEIVNIFPDFSKSDMILVMMSFKLSFVLFFMQSYINRKLGLFISIHIFINIFSWDNSFKDFNGVLCKYLNKLFKIAL